MASVQGVPHHSYVDAYRAYHEQVRSVVPPPPTSNQGMHRPVVLVDQEGHFCIMYDADGQLADACVVAFGGLPVEDDGYGVISESVVDYDYASSEGDVDQERSGILPGVVPRGGGFGGGVGPGVIPPRSFPRNSEKVWLSKKIYVPKMRKNFESGFRNLRNFPQLMQLWYPGRFMRVGLKGLKVFYADEWPSLPDFEYVYGALKRSPDQGTSLTYESAASIIANDLERLRQKYDAWRKLGYEIVPDFHGGRFLWVGRAPRVGRR